MRADLHLHSNASDGSLSPSAVAWAARAGGLDLFAICDHDTVAGLAEAQAGSPAGTRLITGIEISSAIGGRELHVLGYGIDPACPALLAYTARAATARAERMREMIARLANLRVPVTYDDVIAAAEVPPQCLGRPHLARALMNRGQVRTIGEAFERFIGNESPAYVPADLLPPAAAIELIHDAGGLAVWAHPRLEIFDREVRRLRERGLDGVECYRPRATPTETQYYETAARDLDMLRTGGSDWHGSWHGPLGEFAIGESELALFLARLP
ncbi:MAG: PHP domain-containing protein [Gemmatimonadetes bacterium]|nr:PHP domain-containing protein [Gemmatimonadota bacterium]